MSVESIGRVLNHSRAKGTAKLVLVGIANHDGDGGAWPSIGTLMRYANADRRTVQRAIRDLVALGEVVVHDQDGGTRATREDRRPNRYTITVDPREGGAFDGAASTPPRGPNGAAPVAERGGVCGTDGAAPTPPEPSSNHPQPSSTPSPEATVHPIGAEFERFWGVYPRRVGKATARKAWLKAITRTDPETIIGGATRMAADPNLPAERFVPHPSTWLNRDGWEDAPYPVQSAGPANTTERVSQAMEVARRMAEAEGQPVPRAIGGGR